MTSLVLLAVTVAVALALWLCYRVDARFMRRIVANVKRAAEAEGE